MPASAAARATAASSAAAPARMRVPSTLMLAEGGRQPDHDARNAAIADQKIGADADHRDPQIGGLGGQERRQIFGIGGTEQHFRVAAGAEPDEILRAAHSRHRCRARAAARSRDGIASRLALPCFQCRFETAPSRVIEPAPRQTMAPPGLARFGATVRGEIVRALDGHGHCGGHGRAAIRHRCRGRCLRSAFRPPDRPAR